MRLEVSQGGGNVENLLLSNKRLAHLQVPVSKLTRSLACYLRALFTVQPMPVGSGLMNRTRSGSDGERWLMRTLNLISLLSISPSQLRSRNFARERAGLALYGARSKRPADSTPNIRLYGHAW